MTIYLSRTSDSANLPAVPPCFTVYPPYTCRNTIIFPATDVCPHVTEYSAVKAFDCALRGPFGSLDFRPALTCPDSLCAHNCFDLRFNGLFR